VIVLDEKRIANEKRFWSKTAKKYDSWVDRAFKDQYVKFKLKIAQYINKNDSVLEIGTGTGEIAFHIAPLSKTVKGVDISPEMIEVANMKKSKSKIKNISFSVGDAYNLPFPNSSFDKIITSNSLQTMREPEKAIIEGQRILKPGGEFISITYCYGDSSIFEQLKLIKWVLLYGMPVYWKNFTRNDLKALFKQANFQILELEDVWNKPVALFIQSRKNNFN
jgi:ubiquinone/menaquinone biosynthesis C-methylase UbiE